nr:hypothetical protein [Bifidobacterium felsineum]
MIDTEILERLLIPQRGEGGNVIVHFGEIAQTRLARGERHQHDVIIRDTSRTNFQL